MLYSFELYFLVQTNVYTCMQLWTVIIIFNGRVSILLIEARSFIIIMSWSLLHALLKLYLFCAQSFVPGKAWYQQHIVLPKHNGLDGSRDPLTLSIVNLCGGRSFIWRCTCTLVFIPTIVYATHGQRVAAIITINVIIGYLSDHSRGKLVNKSDSRRKSFTIS